MIFNVQLLIDRYILINANITHSIIMISKLILIENDAIVTHSIIVLSKLILIEKDFFIYKFNNL